MPYTESLRGEFLPSLDEALHYCESFDLDRDSQPVELPRYRRF